MNETDFIRLVSEHRVVARVRAQSAESALRAAEAAIVGGIKLIEIALVTPGSFRVLSDLRRSLGDRATIGAGSVMTYDQADRAIKSGAQFVSFPHTSAPLVEQCRRWRAPAIVGALTPTEVAEAVAMDVPLVNVFPASSLGGPDYFRRLTWSMPDVRLAAGGGVSPENIVDYFNAGAYAIVVGGSLFTSGDLQNENYVAIAERARGIIRLAGVA
jgi:2-dehydro-3-deoxyphosphogluconate aldolase/(4S)-4-hydroxy-2-oxoglutarate aldolase